MIKNPKIGQCPHCGDGFHANHHCHEMDDHSNKIEEVKKAIAGRINHTVSKAKSIEEWGDAGAGI